MRQDPATAARGTATALSPGLADAWAHPLLGRMLRSQSAWHRLDQRHPWLLDTAVVLVVALLNLPDLLSDRRHGSFGDTSEHHQFPTPVLVAFAVALVVPLWWRRRNPAVTYGIVFGVSLAQWSLGVWQQTGMAGLVALYSLALHGSLRALGWAAALTAAELGLLVGLLAPVEHPLLSLFFVLGTATAAVAIGLTLRIRRLYLTALEDRAKRLEIEHDQHVRLTSAAERTRIAREMHDIVGHNLSVMVSVADGAATLATNRGETTADALRVLADTGRQAMSELRRVLGVLREDQEEGHDEEGLLSPQPGIRDLDPLLTRVRAAGLPVAYRTTGDLDALATGVQLTVYRIVQEALTNTLKHAGPDAKADVTVAKDTDTVRITVSDTGLGNRGTRSGDAGHGLVGIRQRAAMYGGIVTLGPRATGHGWVVDVVLDVPPGDHQP
ncbi:signal transduction histidine kinase [Streptomyces sp. SAI-208]|jgi:signal transduction histidine kinase|uniref:sensor histidine kinase n=1 Tax=unclassified Streptomyces TaxID=2593676 RepID=UPI0024756797|nr:MULTISPECIES: histidine kinase [unclassified Streptomyces]MDH6514012.1 signal transduction histidine kinase [Streptomyces sp. SAI-090]MDH6546187.1 signal transduction histidine kinase [Streptomyces sp. SAI-041]MDH6565267.1 signal transduction histidine kinase [Streptomyces sp. SAI-117]MDH6604847.1 signal transduction histidine kinase [Streptomyces sp. SAI-208]MDH6621907.1 signal transduction histidine kinase [Streptomyces sp. SAI-135]